LKNSDKAEVKLDSWAAECLFGSTYLLLYLCEQEKQLKFYKEFYIKEKNNRLPRKFFEGFKLALTMLLHRIASQITESPESIGVRRSKKIDSAYHFGSDEKSTIRKLPNLSVQGILVTNLLTFRKKILESRNWHDLWQATESLRDFLHPFQEIFLSCYVGKIDQSDQCLGPENALKTKLPELILVFMTDENNLRLAFKEMYRLQPQAKTLEQYRITLEPKQTQADEDPFRFLHEDVLKSRESYFEVADKAGMFIEGFKFANTSLWQLALGDNEFNSFADLFSGIKKAKSWTVFDEAFDKLNGSVVSHFEKKNRTNETNLILIKKVPNDLRHKLIVPLEKPRAVQTQLSDVFNHRPAKVIGFEGSNGASQFCTVLLGLVYQNRVGIMKEKAQVIEFVHKQKIRGNDYSYALFIPTSSNIADYSRWWVFYRCATDYSGYGGSCFAQICSSLKNLKPFIHFKRFAINEVEFFEYFRSDYIRFIEEECKKAIDDNSSLRGAFLELLVAMIFVKSGYKVLLRHRSKFLGKKEIDVVATKQDSESNVIYVVECKERSLTADAEEFNRISEDIFSAKREKRKSLSVSQSDAMYKIIEDFENQKLTPLKASIQQFAKEIDFQYRDDTKLIGVLATTELFEVPKKMFLNIDLWTYWTLRKKLQEVNIDRSFIEIIENYLKGTIGRPIADFHFNKDYFD
jgi:hypothetical protein